MVWKKVKVGGWMDVKAILRIAYSNQKLAKWTNQFLLYFTEYPSLHNIFIWQAYNNSLLLLLAIKKTQLNQICKQPQTPIKWNVSSGDSALWIKLGRLIWIWIYIINILTGNTILLMNITCQNDMIL